MNEFSNHIEIDAKGKVLGRLATHVANVLRGKDLPNFAPNKFPERKVIVKNVNSLALSEEKRKTKIYWRYSGFPGGIHAKTLEQRFKQDPKEILRMAIFRMLPNNKLRKRMIKNLDLHLNSDQNGKK